MSVPFCKKELVVDVSAFQISDMLLYARRFKSGVLDSASADNVVIA